MVNPDMDPLPVAGENVRVTWGRGTVQGRVIDAYRDLRPRVVVELASGEIGDDATTVTVPVGSVEPVEDSTSLWAEGVRYERELAEAFRRVLGRRLASVEQNVELPDSEVDLLVRLNDGRELAVEVKKHVGSAATLRRMWMHVREAADSEHALALFVVSSLSDVKGPAIDLATTSPLIVWSDPDDDSRLDGALSRLLDSEQLGRTP